MVDWIMAPQNAQILILGNCKYVTSYCARDFCRDFLQKKIVIKVMDLKEIILDYLSDPNLLTWGI